MARAATSPELALFRTPGKWSKLYCAILTPPIVYRARVNQTFSSLDQVISIVYDGGSGTLSDVLPDMEVWIGSSLDAHDKGICRLRDKDATHFYLSETSEIQFADNDYVTILAGYQMWARPVRITEGGTVYMDETTYSDQHSSWDPMPNMGSHKVAELTGSSVNVGFDGSSSFCPGSSISTYAWSCATASASAGTSTSTCTFQFDTVGWHIVYLVVTAANGKSFFGVRYVYIWSQDDPPPLCEILNPGHCDVDSGGWEIELRLYNGAGLSEIYVRAMVILFSEDHFGDTVQAIGPVAGSENIRFVGWISAETHHLESEQGSVSFRAHGAAYWMGRIPSWPDGVKLTNGATSWTDIQNLTVDLGVYHFLRWRSTATRVMDVTLSGDTKLSQEVASSAQNLWAQLQEMTWAQIYARPGVNAQGQLSVQIHPSLIPTADRTAPTVMAITKADYLDGLDFERAIVEDVGIVDMSGITVSGPGVGSAYFALAPGHSLPHYGDWDIQPNLLLASQAQVITLAGLYRSLRNNPYKSIPIIFDAPIGLIDCFPNQKCTIDIQPGDNVRGLTYTGGLIPTSVDLVQDPDTGYLHTEVTFEAETSESRSMQGDTPGSGATDGPVSPSFPPLPPLPPIVPGGLPPASENGPTSVVVHDVNTGFSYTTNFDESSPTWASFNAGLTAPQYQSANRFIRTPSGVCYCAHAGATFTTTGGVGFVARAPSIGGTWTVLYDAANLASGSNRWGILGIGHNSLLPDTVGIVIENGQDASSIKFYLGTSGSFSIGATVTSAGYFFPFDVSYGLGKWMCSSYWNQSDGRIRTLPANASSMTVVTVDTSNSAGIRHVRASSTGKTFHDTGGISYELYIGANNGASFTGVDSAFQVAMDNSFATTPNYFSCDPTGTYCMTRWNGKGRSSDGGATWVAIPNLPVGNWWFDYAGTSEDGNVRFVAAGGTSVRCSLDFGEIWLNKEGTGLAAIPNINMVKVLGY